MIRAAGVALVMVLAGTPPPATAAADPQAASINAVAFSPLPSDTPIHVRALDNSEAALELKAEFETALRATGRSTTAEAGGLVLTLNSGRELGDRTNRERNEIREQRRQLENRVRERYAVSLFDSDRDRAPRARRPRGVTPTRYRLEATLDDRVSGRVLWRGWAVAPLHRGAERDLIEAMIPVLAGALGQTIRHGVFSPD